MYICFTSDLFIFSYLKNHIHWLQAILSLAVVKNNRKERKRIDYKKSKISNAIDETKYKTIHCSFMSALLIDHQSDFVLVKEKVKFLIF
jgi:hypothetical protein